MNSWLFLYKSDMELRQFIYKLEKCNKKLNRQNSLVDFNKTYLNISMYILPIEWFQSHTKVPNIKQSPFSFIFISLSLSSCALCNSTSVPLFHWFPYCKSKFIQISCSTSSEEFPNIFMWDSAFDHV